MKGKRVTIIGLGLMGGSLGLALKQRGLAAHVVGCGREALLTRAMEMGAIDSGAVDAGEAAAESDFVFLCTPVETSIGLLREIAPRLKAGALVTDVGSTKEAFAAAAREIFGEAAHELVLPGHPLAGKEVSGLEYAEAELYSECLWVLTPLGSAEVASHGELREALARLGARVMEMDAAEHDRTLAYTSHLPQMLSTALALTLKEAMGEGNPGLRVHAGGLRAMLRLAESDAAMWEQIADSNRENLAGALEGMERVLRELRERLGTAEFRGKFEEGREFAKGLRK